MSEEPTRTRPPDPTPPEPPRAMDAPVPVSAGGRSGALRRHVQRIGRTPWAVADQGLMSATNFVTMVLLARGLEMTAFGQFTLAYAGLLLGNTLQSGLITEPHNVIGSARSGDDYIRYTRATATMQIFLTLALGSVALGSWLVAATAGWAFAELLLPLAAALVAWQMQEFARRVLYTEGRLAAAFANDVFCYGGQTLVIGLLWWTGLLTAPLALWAFAGTTAIAAILGRLQISRSLRRPGLENAGGTLRSGMADNWHFGKWLVATEMVGNWLSSQLLVFIVAAVLGAAAAGVLKAVNTLFGPMRIIAYALNTVLPVRFSRAMASRGVVGLREELASAYWIAAPILVVYGVLVAVFAAPLLRLVFGDKYAGFETIVWIFDAAWVLAFVWLIAAAALKATRRTRQIFAGRAIATAVGVPVGIALMYPLGLDGAAIGMLVIDVLLLGLIGRACSKALRLPQDFVLSLSGPAEAQPPNPGPSAARPGAAGAVVTTP